MTYGTPLYFDKVENRTLNWETNDLNTIFYNLKKIDVRWFNEFTDMLGKHNKADLIFAVGRFVVVISMTFNENERYMQLLDLNNDELYARFVAGQSGDQERIDRFMNAFYATRENYEKDYNKFLLVIGKPPNQSIAAETNS